MLGWVAKWHRTLDQYERPTYAGYDLWQRDQRGAPSGSLLRVRLKHLGGWAEIVREGVQRGEPVTPRCERCNSSRTRPIVYGLYGGPRDDVDAGKIVLGGCCRPFEPAEYDCADCGHNG